MQLCVNVWAYFYGFFLALFWECRKVVMCECWRGPYINVLSLEMSSHLNGENWTNVEVVWLRAKLNQWKICVGHYERMENGCHIMETCHTAIFPIADPPKLGFCFSNVNRSGKLASVIMKKWKNGCHIMETHHTAKFPITNSPQFGSPLFQVSIKMENGCQLLWKHGKMTAMPQKLIVQQI